MPVIVNAIVALRSTARACQRWMTTGNPPQTVVPLREMLLRIHYGIRTGENRPGFQPSELLGFDFLGRLAQAGIVRAVGAFGGGGFGR